MHSHKTTAAKPLLISIVIPAFNEELNVWQAYERTREIFETALAHYDFEIIFTDNHSTDNTYIELEKIALRDKRVKVARFTRNYGFNNSLITGYRLAKGEAAIQLDCDLQDPPSLFPVFIKKWEEGHDVVVGLRPKRQEPKLLLLARRTFYRFLSRISQDNLVIDGGDFRLIDRSILNQLREIHDATPYVRGLVSTLATNQTSFEYERSKRTHGKSKFPVIRLLGLAVEGIVNHSTVPLRLATIIGLLIATLAIVLSLGYFVARVVYVDFMPAGFATGVILELLSIGLNGIFLGIIGEYLGHIHRQLRDRPITVIQRVINLTDLDMKFVKLPSSRGVR